MLVHNQTENGMNGENRHCLPQAYDCVSNRGLRQHRPSDGFIDVFCGLKARVILAYAQRARWKEMF